MGLALVEGTALWVDAAGTLLHPARPIADVYAEHARARGHGVGSEDIGRRLAPAMTRHRALRTSDPSWSGYWRAVVAETLGVDDPRCFEQLYAYYRRADAWTLAPTARATLASLRERGVRLALISNWDTRLRATLEQLDIVSAFDTLLISGEEGVEKPEPEIFERAITRLAVPAQRSMMVGDSRKNDVAGARAVGAFVMQFGSDISRFDELLALR